MASQRWVLGCSRFAALEAILDRNAVFPPISEPNSSRSSLHHFGGASNVLTTCLGFHFFFLLTRMDTPAHKFCERDGVAQIARLSLQAKLRLSGT